MISSHRDHLLPSSCTGILYVFSPSRMCYHQRYRLSSVMARRAAPQWHGRKQTRTVIGLSEVCVHAIPHGELNSTPKPRKVIVLDTTNLSLLSTHHLI
ncbi:hypothetical protein Bca52824_026752 [Brassica carinata]|uniref:Uncharacterized protein n=1 Tax=Brassica carinata TaxID=52824 RepID=A0A8X7V938_BRACI|nr:hypothetical protein Bca52824_026752 [Brassica carinata]